MSNRNVTSVETFTGKYLDYLDPKPEQIELADIARGLSGINRFAAQINPRTYSVAEHAVYVRNLVIEEGYPECALAALHHDSHEAYMGDWPAPLKHTLGQGVFDQIADGIDDAICQKFNIYAPYMKGHIVKAMDNLALRREAATLKYSHGVGEHWGYDHALTPLAGIGWSPERAEWEFLRAHEEEMARHDY